MLCLFLYCNTETCTIKGGFVLIRIFVCLDSFVGLSGRPSSSSLGYYNYTHFELFDFSEKAKRDGTF